MVVEIAKKLIGELNKIESPGDFCVSDVMEPCFPGLEVKKIGQIGFPISNVQAKEIIKHCTQAPYGRGEKTLVDTDVRRVWQLEPKQFKFTNPEWKEKMELVVLNIQEKLGLGDKKITSELYKLLVYEKGDFFVSHRDTEKANNMFGTLVVVLPTDHKGGDLIVEHDGKKRAFSFGNKKGLHNVQYAAFYTDCKHEVKPVTQGYRICLIYNLAISGIKKQPVAPIRGNFVDKISLVMNKWVDQNEPAKLAVLLDHQYTEAGLSFDSLKNLDRAKVEILIQAAANCSCVAHLALLTLYEMGDAECDYSYNRYDDEENEDYTMGEIFESSLSVDNWIDIEGDKQNYGEIDVDEAEIVSSYNINDGDPDEEEVEGPTGNAGATIDRWYRLAALMLWPKHLHYNVLSQAGNNVTIPQLEKMVKGFGKSKKVEKGKKFEQCRLFANEIINRWSIAQFGHADVELNVMLGLLIAIGDFALIKKFLEKAVIDGFGGSEAKNLALIFKQFGLSAFKEELNSMAEQDNYNRSWEFAQILKELCCFKHGDDNEILEICCELAEKSVTNIKKWDAKKGTPQYGWQEKKPAALLIENMYRSLCGIDKMDLLENLTEHFITDKTHYKTRSVIIPALKKIHPFVVKNLPYSQSYKKLLDHCICEIEKSTSKTLKKPSNWAQKVKSDCNCADCSELNTFLQNPNEQVHRFKAGKNRRQHLHQKIDSYVSDMTHVTERKGSPFTLVCTKTMNSHFSNVKGQKRDFEMLKDLQRIRLKNQSK